MNQEVMIEKINLLLDERDIPLRQRNAFLAQLLGLHYTSVQKKMGAKKGWTPAQIDELSAYFDTPLDALIESKRSPRVSALIKYGSRMQRGKITVGSPLLDIGSDELVAIQTSDGWLVTLGDNAVPGECYTFTDLETLPPPIIAILDDEAEIRESITYAFERIGFKCKEFSTTSALSTSIETMHYDGFILDWMLTEGTTPEKVIAKIRAGSGNNNVPIIILTGKLETQYVDESELAKMVQAYRVMIIEKPMRPKIMGTTLFNMIMQRKNK